MYSYSWDIETGGLLLNSSPLSFSKEPRPVYYKELDILGFDKYWNYAKNDTYPYMWAEANNYIYRGRVVAKTKGGSLYTAPEVVVLEEPEPNGMPLRFVDIPAMVEKNHDLLEKLSAETIKKIYNTYVDYKNKVDVFYVAFSGGKDSIVALDLVQRALPHNAFMVLFGDTDMEFPTTDLLVENVQSECANNSIPFYIAKSDLSSQQSWDLFGPPARRNRWCCTVHKTAPVINLLSDLINKGKLRAMMITGVRGDESAMRADYDELSLGKKIIGQYSFHPILEYSSAEVFLYIYANNLLMNEAYKMGFNRVGCVMCPNSAGKHEYMKQRFFPELVDKFASMIVENSSKDLSGENAKIFLETGGWKTRLSGRELRFSEKERFTFEETHSHLIFSVTTLKPEWKIWYKTIGILEQNNQDEYLMEYGGVYRHCKIVTVGDITQFIIDNNIKSKNSIEFIYYFKSLLAKTQYCIQCKTCVAECPYGNISMANGVITVSNHCIHCHACLRILSGCLYYNSVRGSDSVKSAKGINRYFSVGVDGDWVKQYLEDTNYEPGNKKTDAMFAFLSDAGITAKKKLTSFGEKIHTLDLNTVTPWALMLCNLAYSSVFGWYIRNIPFNIPYYEASLLNDIEEDTTKKDGGKKARGEFWNSMKVILDTMAAYKEIGFGMPQIERKKLKNGTEQKSMISIVRTPWANPEPLVILYSLFKFAEACGDYYQFTLSRLLNHDIDSDGISPTEIFGLDREQMEKILNGLSINYPDFINASFTLDLDNITLNSEKTSQDVLKLF